GARRVRWTLPDSDEFFYLKPPFVVVVAEETHSVVVFDLGVVRPCEVNRLIVDCRRAESSRARWGSGALSARGIGISPTVEREHPIAHLLLCGAISVAQVVRIVVPSCAVRARRGPACAAIDRALQAEPLGARRIATPVGVPVDADRS